VDARSIGAIGRCEANPSLSTLTQIADALGVSPKVLFEEN
jgi:hypothetical protein